MPEENGDDKVRQLEEQIAFLERELEHQREQIADLWSELDVAKRRIARLARGLDERDMEDS